MATGRKAGGRAPGWSKARERRFLEHLASSSNIAAAERVAIVPPGSAYKRRQHSAAFRAAFDAALAEGYCRLEFAMLERAIHGDPVIITDRAGNKIERREYSERLALNLLNQHREAVAATGAIDAHESAQQRLARKLEEMSQRMAAADD